MKLIEATNYNPKTKVAIFDLSDLTHALAVNLTVSLNLETRTARFFIPRITSIALCDVEISPFEFRRILEPGAGYGGWSKCGLNQIELHCLTNAPSPEWLKAVHTTLEEILTGHSWSLNTLENSLGPATRYPNPDIQDKTFLEERKAKDPRIGAEVSFDHGTWGVIEEIWESNSHRSYEAFWVRDEEGCEHELTQDRIDYARAENSSGILECISLSS